MRTFAERRGTPDLAEYGKRLRRDAEELDAFLDRVTINVSHLWRHEDQFEALRTPILPELAPSAGALKIWSAGSSYGAEAYTLAAVCREAIPTVPVEIHGTDLDKRMVARAREGRFTAEDARTVAARPCCSATSTPQPDGGWQAKPELQADGALRNRGPAAHAGPDRPLRPGLLPQHRHLLHRRGPRRAARAARQGAGARRLPGGRHLRARRRPARRSASPRPFHFIYRKS